MVRRMISRLKQLIANSKNIVFLTGAGISTHSGIPDYRSANGVYSDNPEYMLSRPCWKNNYYRHMDFIRDKMNFKDAEPNDIHKWIASLQDTHNVHIITQNIDGLHHKAGSKNIINFHGDINIWHCVKCNKEYNMDYVLEHNECECNGKLNSNVVLYGDDLHDDSFKAYDIVNNADLIIVIGTSLKVYPFAELIFENPFCPKVLINKEHVETGHYSLEIIDDALNIIKQLEE